jgi:hypothetical protein
MKINITAGDCLNNILTNKYKNEKFVPFREAMIKGTYSSKLFSDEFIKERAIEMLEENLKHFIRSQVFIDYFSMIFSCAVVLFLFFNIFFNISTFFEHYLGFLF